MRYKDNLVEQLRQQYRFYTSKSRRISAELRTLPDSKLQISFTHGSYCFYEGTSRSRKGITRDKTRVYQLARAWYLRLQLMECEAVKRALKGAASLFKNSTRARSPEERLQSRFGNSGLDLRRIRWTADQFRRSKMQSQNPYHKEELTVETNSGIMVRSISEKVWMDLYAEVGIPVQFERRLSIDVTDLGHISGSYQKGGRWYKDYYPDITLLLAGGKCKYHEHMGLISDEEYLKRQGERLVAFVNGGIAPSDLLLTFPKDVLDSSSFRKFLETEILPLV